MESYSKVRQVLVAAGGKGNRISPEFNPNGSKVLIEHKGKTLFEHQLDSLIAGGFERIIISTGYHTDRKIREVVRGKKIEAIVIPISEMGSFRWIPYYMQDLLEERFLFVCGHQPLDPSFVREMVEASKVSKFVASAYEGGLFFPERARNMKILYNSQGGLEIASQDLDIAKLSDVFFIDSPYVLTKDIVSEFSDNNGQGEYSNYILTRYTLGESLTVVKASMPPEFDYDVEFARTISSL